MDINERPFDFLANTFFESDYETTEHQKKIAKNQSVIGDFTVDIRYCESFNPPSHYDLLFAWALHQYLKDKGYQVIQYLGYSERKPHFEDINTGSNIKERKILMDGQMLVKKGPFKFIITVDLLGPCSILVETPEAEKEEAIKLIKGFEKLAYKKNFYRGQKFIYGRRIDFPSLEQTWDSIVIDQDTKDDIIANSTGVFDNLENLKTLGIPTKRGILLAGPPGCGKTAIIKAIMNDAVGVTCILAKALFLDTPGYINGVFAMAQDLTPAMVIIEDIDSVAVDRNKSFYREGPILFELLNILDGIEQRTDMIVIATTNYLTELDGAIKNRPNRFDRVIPIRPFSPAQRQELVRMVSKNIPLNERTQAIVVEKTSGYSPVQVIEVIRGLVIKRLYKTRVMEPSFNFSEAEIAQAAAFLNIDTSKDPIGYPITTKQTVSLIDSLNQNINATG